VSTCLLGENVRASGGHSRDAFLVDTLGRWVEWVPVCPEVEMGMPTPRPTIRLAGDPASPRLVPTKGEGDHTEAMEAWGRARLEALARAELDGYVFKKNSPSCGVFRVKVYRDSGMPARDGRGIFARMVTEAFPLLPVEEDGRLNDARLRENFVERVFAHQRWRGFVASNPRPRDLVAFHTAQKMALLAHSPEHYRRLGRLVAEAGRRPLEDLLAAYGATFMQGLSVLAKRGRHANVLSHLLGFLKDRLDAHDKSELVGLIEEYRSGLVPLIVPLTLLKHHLGRHPVPDWVHVQVYLTPYPKELMLRNHV
jgi:uncharacterized protein YbgA (DUF1722 family)/uncharacterized protein YbbK (DUF523 family)